jgi:thiol:disulfide interchange protein
MVGTTGVSADLLMEKVPGNSVANLVFFFMTAIFASGFAGSKAFCAENSAALRITAVSSHQSYAPGDSIILALRVAIPHSYHLYGNPLGPGIGKPITISATGEGIAWDKIIASAPDKYTPALGDWVWAYKDKAYFFLKGTVRTDKVTANDIRGTISVDALICQSSCIPSYAEIPFMVSIGAQSAGSEKSFHGNDDCRDMLGRAQVKMAFTEKKSAGGRTGFIISGTRSNPFRKYDPQEENSAKLQIWSALLLGFLAGIILNAMPCVLPILGIKVLSFSHGRKGQKGALVHSLVFSGGVLAVFMALAGAAAIANVSWGQQFQDPRSLIAIGALIVVFSLGMFDVYTIFVPHTVAELENHRRSGIWGDFFRGVFATILATPCSGPFLGAVLAWSITQSAGVIFAVYGAVGTGMSFPYILLSSFPALARFIPAPGKWMQVVKVMMGILLVGFAAYLVLGLPGKMVLPTLLFYFIVSVAVFVFSKNAPWNAKFGRKFSMGLVSLLIAGAGLWFSYRVVSPSITAAPKKSIELSSEIWQPFSADSLLNAHDVGRTAIVDFTAAWCMNCQYNAIAVFNRKEIADLIKSKNLLALKADMTTPDKVVDSLLRNLGSRSIPFFAIFPGHDPYRPVVMRDVLTLGRVAKALAELPDTIQKGF